MQGVIFDMDGLLFDSERIGLDVMREAGRKQGKQIPDEAMFNAIGVTSPVGKRIYADAVPGLDADRLFDDFGDGMLRMAEEGRLPLKKGAEALLMRLRERGIPCAVASSSPEKYVRLYLESQHITFYFDVLIGGPEGIRSKPEPDIFLLAAEKLGIAPADCLVLEDSLNGIRAGRAAGMTVCMVPDLVPYRDDLAPYVDAVLPDLYKVGEKYFP